MYAPVLKHRSRPFRAARDILLIAGLVFFSADRAAAEEGASEDARPLATLRAYLPEHYIAAYKDRDVLTLVNNGEESAFAMIHGANVGDKTAQGDRKTPEGVYFITKKISYPLDPVEYGVHAFATDYPNPVDKLRGKTGSGIWIHSKGYPIAGKTTRGCLAVGAEDIETLVPELTVGTPVMIFGSTENDGPEDAAACETLTDHSRAWAKMCAAADAGLSDLYDRGRFKKAMGKRWIDHSRFVRSGEDAPAEDAPLPVRVLKGTGYSVSVFDMPLRGGGTEKVRLYWLDSGDGWKIVGESFAAAG